MIFYFINSYYGNLYKSRALIENGEREKERDRKVFDDKSETRVDGGAEPARKGIWRALMAETTA